MIARVLSLFRRQPSELELWWAERETNLKARRTARQQERTYVAAHYRRKV